MIFTPIYAIILLFCIQLVSLQCSPSPKLHSFSFFPKSLAIGNSNLYNETIVKRSWQNCVERLKSSLKSEFWRFSNKKRDFEMLCLVNTRSGGKAGEDVLYNLTTMTDTLIAHDVTSHATLSYFRSSFFRWMRRPLRLVTCGGDGTFKSVIDTIRETGLPKHVNISYGIVPLGTGNDLFRQIIRSYPDMIERKAIQKTLSLVDKEFNSTEMVEAFNTSSSFMFIDRWKIDIRITSRDLVEYFREKRMPEVNPFGDVIEEPTEEESIREMVRSIADNMWASLLPDKTGQEYFTNYLGIGVDAGISMNYDKIRKNVSYLFVHKIINQILYAMSGFYAFFRMEYWPAPLVLDLYCDGFPCEIPSDAQGLILSNIQSYAGGTRLWPVDEPCAADDGLIELVAVKSLPHIGRVTLGLASAIPVCQGRNITIKFKTQFPIQLDGEPVNFYPCTMTITPYDKIKIIRPNVTASKAYIRMKQKEQQRMRTSWSSSVSKFFSRYFSR